MQVISLLIRERGIARKHSHLYVTWGTAAFQVGKLYIDNSTAVFQISADILQPKSKETSDVKDRDHKSICSG